MRRLSIRTRLQAGFAVLSLLILVMGLFAIREMHAQSEVTVALYRHPMTVGQSVRDIQSLIIKIHRDMKDVVLVENPNRVDEFIEQVEIAEATILSDYDLVESRFLGSKEHVRNARKAFTEWRAIRDQVFELVRQGDNSAAAAITLGTGARHVDRMQQLNTVMSDFASFKGEEFYADSRELDRRAITFTVIMMVFLVVVSVLVALFIERGISGPIGTVMAGVAQLSKRRFDRRIDLMSNDEIGLLARAVNDMAAELESTTTSIEELNREIREREIAEEKAQGLGQIIESSLSEILVFDMETLELTMVNLGARKNLGYTGDELAAMTILDLGKAYSRSEFLAEIEPLVVGGQKRLLVQTVLTRKDGSEYRVDADLQSARFEDRPVVIGVVVDCTEQDRQLNERRALETKVQHTQKLESLGVLAGGIAHDFNNILMAILGNAALALEDLPQTSPVRDSLVNIEMAAKRAAELCRQMLAYSGKGRFVVENLSVNDLVVEIGKMLEISISKNVSLNFKLADDLPPVKADASQIGQVVLNLITNASDAIGDGNGVISVTTGSQMCNAEYIREISHDSELHEGQYVYLEVTDNGCGMDQEAMNRVFEPFFTTKFTGRGLGMAAVLGIIRGHGGTIKIYSEIGKGTAIKVLLPVSVAAGADSVNSLSGMTRAIPEIKLQGGLVLLVDDEARIRDLGRRMLQRMGFDVLVAEDGVRAVEMFKEHQDDLAVIIIDLTMPRMGGQDAAREIRRINSKLPIILSSGYNEQELTQNFVGRGLAGFIQKPYQPQDLAAKLNEVLGA